MGIQQDAVAAAVRHREENGPAILGWFAGFLALRNLAADLPAIRSNAAAIVEALTARGVAAEAVEIAGAPPLVLGMLDVGADRTVGIYAHYDGQPADPAEWTYPPWQPTLCSGSLAGGAQPLAWPGPGEPIDPDWRIYARSAADDKAPVAALLAALDALASAGLRPTANLVVAFEGEEEVGSPQLPAYLAEHRERLAADVWLICDGPVHPSGRPQVVFGVRGISEMEITVYGPVRDLHSGHYGNWAFNPAMRLAQLLASMKDEDGNVLVAGFYDGTAPITPQERTALAALPAVDDDLRSELGLAATEAAGASSMERVMIPSLNVRGLAAGGVGRAARNVVPAEATASMDVRLAPGNDPAEMLERVERHIRAQGYHMVRNEPDHETRLAHPRLARVISTPGYPGVRVPVDSPVARRVLAASGAAAGEDPVAVPTLGGSVPLHLFTTALAAPVVIAPLANHDNSQHAADENLRVGNLWYGIDLMAALLTM